MPNTKSTHKICQRLLKQCQSGHSLPNRVTLHGSLRACPQVNDRRIAPLLQNCRPIVRDAANLEKVKKNIFSSIHFFSQVSLSVSPLSF